MSESDTRTSETGGRTRSKAAVKAGVAIAVVVLVVLGFEAWRQFNKSSGVRGVGSAYDDSIEYLGNPDDWQQHFETRRGKSDGSRQLQQWAAKYSGGDSGGTAKLTEWLQALLGSGSGASRTMPTQGELQALRTKSTGIEADAGTLLAYEFLDSVPRFLPNGEVQTEMEYFYALRTLQVLAAAALRDNARDSALATLELVLELTIRRQSPLGLFDLLTMTVSEPHTHILAGRLSETGSLTPRCNELLAKLALTAPSPLTVLEGELAMGAWRYHVVGIDAMSLDGQSGWFDWSNPGGSSAMNDELASSQRALLELCEDYRAGHLPTPSTDLGRAMVRNVQQAKAALAPQRARSALVVKVRQAIDAGTDPGALVPEAAAAGVKLDHSAGGWLLFFVANADQRKAMGQPSQQDFDTQFPVFTLK